VLLALAAACGSDRREVIAPETSSFDVAAVLGDLAVPAGASAAAAGVGPLLAVPGTGGPASGALAQCAWTAATQAFTCAPYTAGGLTATFAYTPLDAQGAPQRTPDRATTAALRMVMVTNGTVTVPAGDGTPGGAYPIAARQEATLRGLLAGPRTLDGTLDAQTQVGAGAMRVRVQQTTAGLVLPGGGARWPSAGTVTTDVLEAASGARFTRMVMTFNGTSTAAVVLTAGPVTQRCTLDLAATPSTTNSPLQCSAP
jgi:hypothetical protein